MPFPTHLPSRYRQTKHPSDDTIRLLHKQLCKDSAISGQGLPDYVVTFRKPGDNLEPISGMLDAWVGDEELDVSYAAFLEQVRAAAKGLIARGVEPGSMVGIMSPTSYEGAVIYQAIWFAGAASVPVYETSSPIQVQVMACQWRPRPYPAEARSAVPGLGPWPDWAGPGVGLGPPRKMWWGGGRHLPCFL